MPRRDDAMAELRAALSGAPGTRSSLHQWMRANYDEVSTLLVLPRFAWKCRCSASAANKFLR